jgi:hypothetical protein
MSLGTGLTLKPLLGPDKVDYLLRDEFITDRPVGSVNGTPCEPGPGTRDVEDNGTGVSISGGELVLIAVGQSGCTRIGQVPATPGRMLRFHMRPSAPYNIGGFSNVADGAFENGMVDFFSSSNIILYDAGIGNVNLAVGSFAASTDYHVAVVLGAGGKFYGLLKGGAFSNWTLLYPGYGKDNWINPYVGIAPYDAAASSYIRVPSNLWLPTPIAYDTFTRANGSLGSTETTGPDGQSCAARTWTTQLGTVAISGNKAKATALSGGRAIATIEGSKADVVAALALTRGTTGAGLIVRYVDNSNYWYWTHDGTNAKLIERLADTETTKITAAQTYSAGASGVVVADGSAWRLLYDDCTVGTVTDSDLSTATKAGLIFFDTDSTVDNFQLFARGTGGEYAILDNF